MNFVAKSTLAALCALTATAAAGCGSGSSSGGKGKPIVLGTTDKVASTDPASGYGSGDQALMNAIYQGLMYTPPGGSDVKPLLAKSCAFSDPKTYTCTMRTGLKFSNGQPLTAKDVAFSISRVKRINSSQGGAYLLEPLKSVEAPNDSTVTFHLKRPTATWPQILGGPMCLIVPRGVYSPTKIQAPDKAVGSGAYKLTKYTAGQIAVLTPNPHYKTEPIKNSGITFLYYQTPASMRLAFEHGDVDALIAWRSLTGPEVKNLGAKPDTTVLQIPGADGRYLAFNVNKSPVNELPVRQAMASLINRDALNNDVLAGSVKPMYSISPAGVKGTTTAPFKTTYGAAPDSGKAREILTKAHIKTPVALTLWYTPSHMGATAGDELTELSRQLGASGLFKVTLQSSEWQQYSPATSAGSYQGYEASWYPDYADADNYLAGLLNGGWITNYKNATVKRLLEQEAGSTDQAARDSYFAAIERQAAKDVPVIPLYQSNYTMVVHNDIGGVPQSANLLFTLDYAMWTKR